MDENFEDKTNENAQYEEVKESAPEYKKKCKSCKSENDMTVFVLGLLGLVLPLWNPLLAIVGFVLGLIAVIKGNRARKAECASNLSRVGFALGIIAMTIAGVTLVFGCSFAIRFMFPYHFFYRTFWI